MTIARVNVDNFETTGNDLDLFQRADDGEGGEWRTIDAAIGPYLHEVYWTRTMTVTTTAGNALYNTPPPEGYFFDAAGETTLTIDKGSGPVPQVYGFEYSHLTRNSPPTSASVLDIAQGFVIAGSPAEVDAGWICVFTWKKRVILTDPLPIAKVRTDGDYSIAWGSNSAFPPNGVTVPGIEGYQVEFWRQSFKSGGLRQGTLGGGLRYGRRYIPYLRFGTDVWTFSEDEFSPTQALKRNRFKVAYYNPSTGARSCLSNDTIVVCSIQDDGVNGRRPVRTGRSVWIE